MNCNVECPESLLKCPPPLGSIITVKHDGCYATGLLKRPVFWRQKAVENNVKVRDNSALHLLGKSPNWTNHANHKAFFDHLAQSFEISQACDWYKVKREDIKKYGG